MSFAVELVVLVAALSVSWVVLGTYMHGVYEGRYPILRRLERPLRRVLGLEDAPEQSAWSYCRSLLVFSGVSILVTYLILVSQARLPLNPQHLVGVPPALAFNTAVSFVTNTDWQNYAGETTMSYLSQMAALAVQNFVSAAVGMAVAVALIRGIASRGRATIGNFWLDTLRGVLWILLPLALVATVVFVWQGGVETLGGPVHIVDVLNGVHQTIPRGPIASQEAIKQLGTNGGGFFGANGAHPFENPTGLTNLVSVYLVLVIPVALTATFGRMVGSRRDGLVLLGTMAVLFAATLALALVAEHGANPAVRDAAGSIARSGNLVGKEARFGIDNSVLYNVTATQTSTGAVNSSMDSYTPIGGLAMMLGMVIGEISPGGVGSGLYTIVAFAIVTVFIAGLMVGRTPEYLGKKIQRAEIIWASVAVLVMPITVLVATGVSMALPSARHAMGNGGPHGFSEVLYAMLSQGNNNGSAFGGLSSDTLYCNVVGAVVMLLGRFGVIVPVLGLAGSLAGKGVVARSAGTFETTTPMFAGLLIGVVLLVGALSFFPALALGPIAEAVSHGRFFR